MKKTSTLRLIAEILGIFGIVPGLMASEIIPKAPIPLLLVGALGSYFYLKHSSLCQKSNLLGFEKNYFKVIIIRFIPISLALTALVLLVCPERFLNFPMQKPVIWITVMLLYPILSVYPQELIYRSFFFERYQTIFKQFSPLASALCFGWGHILFGNYIAVLLSTAGGYIFSVTYSKTSSTLMASIEHALYGMLIFTIGLGSFFYHANS